MSEEKNKIVVFAIIALVIGLAGGYWYGKAVAVKETGKTIQKLEQSLSLFVPPLPDVINGIGAKITNKAGTTITVEIPSFTDRYPEPGKPQATETRTVRITKDTKITETDFNQKTFKNGMPQTKSITAGDLKIGDVVSVTVKENARTEQNLTATQINRSSGI